MRRVPLSVLLLVSLLIGLAGGLAYAWLIAPGAETNQTPARLNEADRDAYLRLMADSFAADGDRDAAARRLAALGPGGERALLDLLAAGLRSGATTPGDQRLAAMAGALGIDSPAVGLLALPVPLPPATAAPALPPTAVLRATEAAARFALVAREPVCVPGEAIHRLEVTVHDEAGQPSPGVKITVQWPGGEDTFVTGFKAGQDPGYADFDMSPEIVYAVAVGGEAPSAEDLQVVLCPDGQDGGWRLEYEAQAP